jgi:4-hydroxy-tetrahydrodipicolinate reductase
MSDEILRVGVVGCLGRMGREVCKTVDSAPDMELALVVDKVGVGERARSFVGQKAPDLVVNDKLAESLDSAGKVHAIVDFTHPKFAAHHGMVALKRGVSPIIGTSGLSVQDMGSLRNEAEDRGVPAYYIPNFAIGAVLMMKFAMQAAKYFPECEIIEMHHEKKADAPSGTAVRTAELIALSRERRPDKPRTDMIKLEGVRGGSIGDTPIHSVRLPGLLAHQQVLFGGPGEVLTLRHDSMDRSSFMSGVLLALRSLNNHKGLVVGLENVMD